MKESDFTSEVGSEAIASLQGQFQLVVEPLDNAVGEFFFGFEIVQEQLAMGLESAGHPLERFEATAGDARAPSIEELSGPSARRVGPKVLKAFDQEKGAQSAQSAAIRSRMRRRSLALQLRRCLSRVQRVFLSKGASPARASAWTSARWILSMAWLRFLRI